MDSGLASQPVTELSEGVSNATDNERYLNHEILINTLERYGIAETASAQNLFKKHKTVCESAPKDIGRGIPQGSALGPKRFILYITEIQDIPTVG